MKHFKIILLALLCTLLAACPAFAENVLTLPGDLTVIGEEAFSGDTSLETVIVPEGTTAIGSRAFANSSLTKIMLPNSISEIADDAFEGCTGVIATVPADSYALNWCFDNGIEYTLPETPAEDFVYTIENGEATINIYIGKGGDVVIPAKIEGYPVTAVAPYAFSDGTDSYTLTSVSIPEGVTEIGISTFSHNRGLKSVKLPSTLTYIDTYAFSHCSSLESIVIPEGVTAIGDATFQHCTALKTAILPSTLTTLGNGTFGSCTALKGMKLPSSLTTIGNFAFKNCSAMTTLTLNEGLSSIGLEVFMHCDSITSVTVPTTLTVLNESAFHSCDKLKTVVLPDTLTEIGDYAFTGCLKLSEINFPSSLRNIGYKAFAVCYALENVELNEGLTTLCDFAFEDCDNLDTILLPKSLTDIGSYIFMQTFGFTATVHEGSVAHQWCEKYLIDVFIIYPYTYTIADGEATITDYTGEGGSVVIPEAFNGTPVTAIADEAFLGNTTITSITLPDGIAEIGSNAFSGCTALTAVYTTAGSDAATAISGCGIAFIDQRNAEMKFFQSENADGEISLSIAGYTGSESPLTIPADFNGIAITAIADKAFSGNETIAKVTLSEGLLSIGAEAFANSSLTDINLPASLTAIADNAFDGCENLLIAALNGTYGGNWCKTSGLSYILDTDPNPASDFTVKNLTSTTCAITGYTGLRTNVIFPEKIGNRTVTTIAQDAFFNNKNITSVVIPSSVTTLETRAFYNCTALTKVTLSSGLKTIGESAFYNCRFTEIAIPNSVTTISGGAFGYCSKLESVTLPSGLTTIAAETFKSCGALKSITLPASLTTIKNYAFQGAGLTTITIPGKVKTIGQLAFYNCFNLKTAYLPKSITSMGVEAFLSNVEIHCPKGSYAAKWASGNKNTVVYE